MRIEGSVLPQSHLLLSNYLLQFLTLHNGLLLGLTVIVMAVRYVKSPWRRVPPGPRGLPLLGNMLELRDKTWLFGRECKNVYRMFSFVIDSENPVAIRHILQETSYT